MQTEEGAAGFHLSMGRRPTLALGRLVKPRRSAHALTLEQVVAFIGRLYMDKLEADHADIAEGLTPESLVRASAQLAHARRGHRP